MHLSQMWVQLGSLLVPFGSVLPLWFVEIVQSLSLLRINHIQFPFSREPHISPFSGCQSFVVEKTPALPDKNVEELSANLVKQTN